MPGPTHDRQLSSNSTQVVSILTSVGNARSTCTREGPRLLTRIASFPQSPNRTPGSKPRLDTPTPKSYSLPVHTTGATAKDRILTEIAERLFWWIPPQDALEDEARFVAQVMALGTDRDVKSVEAQLGSEVFDRILDNPPPGLEDAQFRTSIHSHGFSRLHRPVAPFRARWFTRRRQSGGRRMRRR
jgi:hypothetical protein